MITIDTPTFLTCPRCHRMTEARVAICDITTGGCGYEVPAPAAGFSDPAAPLDPPADDSSKDG